MSAEKRVADACGRSIHVRLRSSRHGHPGGIDLHRGVDIAPPSPGQVGQAIRSVADGKVVTSAFQKVRGNYVQVRHADGTTPRTYQHLALTQVRVGQDVAVGEQIGVMGKTGTAAGIHLHFKTYPPDANPAFDAADVDRSSSCVLGASSGTGHVIAPLPGASTTATTTSEDDMYVTGSPSVRQPPGSGSVDDRRPERLYHRF